MKLLPIRDYRFSKQLGRLPTSTDHKCRIALEHQLAISAYLR